MTGKRITYFRRLAGMKQVELARACKVSEAAVSLWEAGERTPRDLEAVAAACGVGLAEFYGEIDESIFEEDC